MAPRVCSTPLIARYGRGSTGCCDHQRLTLLAATQSPRWRSRCCSTCGAEGFLSGAGHRRHPGSDRGAAIDLVSPRWRAAAGAGRPVDPRGSGGRQPVLVHRRRRHQSHAQQRAHADQPQAARRTGRSAPPTSSTGCAAGAKSPGISLYLQPVQDLTIEDRVSRTQFQFTLTAPDGDALNDWVPRWSSTCQDQPELADVERPPGRGPAGVHRHRSRRRQPARHQRRPTSTTRSTARSASGRSRRSSPRPTSTAWCLRRRRMASRARRPWSPCSSSPAAGRAGAARQSSPGSPSVPPLSINHVGQFPGRDRFLQSGDGASLGEAVAAIERAKASLELPGDRRCSSRARRWRSDASLSSTLLLVLAAVVTMYIVLGVLYESYIHPITILSTLPSAGLGALLALHLTRTPLDMIAIIGIILLIGIVKKNAIMMIDFALEAERGTRACRAARRDPPGLPAALSPHPHDHAGGAARRAAADAGPRRRARSCANRSGWSWSAGCSSARC
jgi:hypothetical protein